ncbi:MAG TPA: class I SAM-dependent methyltransferase [Actinomycetota bacterium]|nr:class I SAM-dependent methyltransferase [Actinomycetota bacterium]
MDDQPSGSPAQTMRPEVAVFDRDATDNAGYLYTTGDKLSSRLATQRLHDLVTEAVVFRDRRIVDIGCGDGHFTSRFYRENKPAYIVGMDPSPKAVEVAQKNAVAGRIEFVVGDGHSLPWEKDSFDLALIQGVLHHDDIPQKTIAEALRVAPEVMILEPNGNNVILKVIEKTSRYHIEHHERSYFPLQLVQWIRQGGGTVTSMRFGGLVPMFCPDWMAKATKAIEPGFERIPVLRSLGCAVVVLVAQRYG